MNRQSNHTEQPIHRGSNIWNFIVGVISALAILFVLIFVYWFWTIKSDENDVSTELTAVIYQPAPTPGSDLEMIEGNAEIKIPPSAREIHAMTSGFRELDTWVRLDLPADELTSFMDETRCTSPLASVNPDNYAPLGGDPDWWQPYIATDLVECIGGHSYIYQHILVDRSNPKWFTIYVFSATGISYITPTTSSE